VGVIRRQAPRMKAGQVSGWVWWMSILWVVLGAAGSIYTFILSAHLPSPTYCDFTPCWAGESVADVAAAKLGEAAWVLLTIPVLVAGLIRLRGAGERAALWTGAWIVSIGLMFWVANWQTSAPTIEACNNSTGCILTGYRYAVVSWVELPICALFLALGVVMVLAGRAWPKRAPAHEVASASR
jgi:hypothetical protein